MKTQLEQLLLPQQEIGFRGALPEAVIVRLASLIYFNVEINLLTGSIPEEGFRGATVLLGMELGVNHFTGMLTEIGLQDLCSMRSLIVLINHFTGAFPIQGHVVVALKEIQ
eukprot:1530995-Amphidinium_carterae.2